MLRHLGTLLAIGAVLSGCESAKSHPVTTAEQAIAITQTPRRNPAEPLHAKLVDGHWLVAPGDPETQSSVTVIDAKTGEASFYSRAIVNEPILSDPAPSK